MLRMVEYDIIIVWFQLLQWISKKYKILEKSSFFEEMRKYEFLERDLKVVVPFIIKLK